MNPSVCHPDRKVFAFGKCNACYRRERYRDDLEFRENSRQASREFTAKNRASCSQRRKKQYQANRDTIKMRVRLCNHGITLEFLSDLFQKQKGQCAICKKQLQSVHSRNTHIDHHHLTGHVRGLLCNKCNTGIGWLEKNLAYLNPVLSYIRTTERN